MVISGVLVLGGYIHDASQCCRQYNRHLFPDYLAADALDAAFGALFAGFTTFLTFFALTTFFAAGVAAAGATTAAGAAAGLTASAAKAETMPKEAIRANTNFICFP
jgi:hypothetical protein